VGVRFAVCSTGTSELRRGGAKGEGGRGEAEGHRKEGKLFRESHFGMTMKAERGFPEGREDYTIEGGKESRPEPVIRQAGQAKEGRLSGQVGKPR